MHDEPYQDQQNQPNEPILSKRVIDRIRHPQEKSTYILAVFINIIAVLTVIAMLMGEYSTYRNMLSETAEEQGSAIEVVDILEVQNEFDKILRSPENEWKVEIYTTAGILIFLTVLLLEYLYAQTRSQAVKVTPNQFGEIYYMAEKYARIMQLDSLPEIYLVQENGILNAFSSNIIKKKYIQINMDLLEIAYREHKDMSSIGFVLAHEMAHIRINHVSVWNRYTIMLSQIIPIIGPALSRAREYSCDRLAQAVSECNGVDAIMALTMGKHLYKKTNVAEYMETGREIGGFWVWAVNMASSHPILPKRISALSNPQIPGKLF